MNNLDVIFVYAGDPNNDSQSSPYTITRELYRALTANFRSVQYFDWYHTGALPEPNKDTIVLAHPNYPPNTPTWRLFNQNCRLRTLIFPFHHAIPNINLPFDPLVKMADHIFSITGEYWYDTMDRSPFAHWKPKVTRLDMAIDTNAYPYVRDGINGRDFAYIGCDRPEKGMRQLYETFARTKHKLHVYGNVDGANPLLKLSNVQSHGYAATHSEFGRNLCNQCIGFVNISVSDACPTTLLEAGSWGLVVACNEQSGYYHHKEDSIFIGLGDDANHNVHVLDQIAAMTEETLATQIEKTRKAILERHNWSTFTSKVINKLIELI